MKRKSDALSFFSEMGRNKIIDTIARVEKTTSGEIKVLVVSASSILPRLKKADQEKAVIARAKKEFLKLGINKTRDSTGILIMISLEEKMVRIQPDISVEKVLPDLNWESYVDVIINGIKSNCPVFSICHVISEIGNLLAEHFPVKPDDTNEISNDVVVKGRW